MDEPIDLLHGGLPHTIGVYIVETREGHALLDCGPTTTLETLRDGLAARGLEFTDVHDLLLSHIHLDHAGAAGTIVREHPRLRIWVSGIGARHLADPSKLESSARRLYGARFDALFGELAPVPAENISIAEGDVLGWEAFPTPGHASHHVSYLRDGTLFAGDACGVRPGPDWPVLPVCPPPDIDVERWHATIDEIERRGAERLALTHFGLFTDVEAHIEHMRAELDRWAGIVAAGAGPDEFAQLTRPGGVDAALFEAVAPLDQSWQGLRRYFDKRAAATA